MSMTITADAPFRVETDEGTGAPIQSNTPAWLRRRQSGLGASDAPAILGLSTYHSPRDVYFDKIADTITELDSEQIEFGHLLEPVILATVAKRHGNPDSDRHRYLGTIEKSPGLLRSREHPHLLASLDAIVVEADGTLAPLNAKHRPFGRTRWADAENGVPDDVAVQIYQEAIVLGADHGYAAPLFGNTMPEPIRLDVPADFREWYLAESERFWIEHVEARVEPDPILIDDLNAIWNADPSLPPVHLTAEQVEWAREHRRRKDALNAETKAIDELALQLQIVMGDATEAYDVTDPAHPRLAITWRQNRPSAPRFEVDIDQLRRDHPELGDLLDGYMVEVPGRKPARPFLTK